MLCSILSILLTREGVDFQTDLDEHREPLLVLWRASSGSRILPVQVQAVEAMQPKEADGRLDESLTVGRVSHHVGKSVNV